MKAGAAKETVQKLALVAGGLELYKLAPVVTPVSAALAQVAPK